MPAPRCLVPGCSGWSPPSQPTGGIARALAVWHIYEEHSEFWLAVMGDRPPAVPDPRIPAVRALMLRVN